MSLTDNLSLYEFQQLNVDRLRLMPNILIGDEMGLGKTRQGIAIDMYRRDTSYMAFIEGKTLVVTPKTTIRSPWAQHFEEFTSLRVVEVDPRTAKSRTASWDSFNQTGADVFIVHWDALRLMPELAKAKWLHVIADESHRAQNRSAKQTKCLKAIKRVQFKTAMSGTPITNSPDKFWSILNWLYPKEYKSYWRFFGRYVDFDIEYANGVGYKKPKGPNPEHIDELHELIGPFYARHLKKERCCDLHPNGVLPELPDKYYTTIEVELDPKQRKAYNQMRDEMIAWVGNNEQAPLVAPVVVAQLTRLQQFAVAYADLTEHGVKLTDPSTKIDALMQIILDNPDEQFVVFSQFSQLIKLVNERLKEKDVSVVSITGDVDSKFRSGYIDAFQAGKARIFTGTIGAGGVGITLTASSTVVFLDRSWSPALNAQAEDRCHRIGQKNAVQIIDIVAKDTVDQGKATQLKQKWEWIKELLGDK